MRLGRDVENNNGIEIPTFSLPMAAWCVWSPAVVPVHTPPLALHSSSLAWITVGEDNANRIQNVACNMVWLGLCSRIISKVANDAPGRGILAELEADGVNTSYIVVSETGNSPFTYVIVDEQTKSISLDCLIRRRKAKRSVVFYQFLFSHEVGSLKAPGIGSVAGRLLIGTAEAIPPADLVDTTGARDGFIGAVLYAIAASMPPENMLPFAARVATAGCRALGVRSGLPHRSDLCLTPYLV
ncbi:hypothetical protein SUGI_0644760 [Cryptomeria japonica]|nr:hypothetical protein SUGI_0644760 [Cryptomeria japonica]